MNKLPDEILVTIFGYLQYSDLKSAREVSKKFYNATIAHSLIKNEELIIDRRLLKLEGHKIIISLMNSNRFFCNITVTAMHYYDYFCIFKKFGNKIRSITLKRCAVDHNQFTNIILNCPILEELHIISCDDLLIVGKIFIEKENCEVKLPKLKSIEISESIYLTDKSLSRFLMLCPNAERFNLKNTFINCHRGVYHFNYNISSKDVLRSPSINVLTINYIEEVLRSRCTQLRGIDFSDTKINNLSLMHILKNDSLNLDYLNLTNCRELRKTQPLNIGLWQPNITKLQLANCNFITNYILIEICTLMTNLSILDLTYCRFINNEGFRFISRLPKLKELNISHCKHLSGYIIREVVCSNLIAKSLKKLKMNNTVITNEDMIEIAFHLQLYELEICDCMSITDISLHVIFCNQNQLQKLQMAGLNISNIGITGHDNKTLTTADINLYKNISYLEKDKQDEVVCECYKVFLQNKILCTGVNSSINNLCNLEYLNLSKCKWLSDLIFIDALFFRSLRILNLSGLTLVTTYAYFLAFNCPVIEYLDLSGTNIDDLGILVIVKKMKRLKHLSLKNGWHVTNLALEFIIKYCNKLQVLDVEGCYKLNFSLMETISNMPSVQQVIGKPNEYDICEGEVPVPPPMPDLFD